MQRITTCLYYYKDKIEICLFHYIDSSCEYDDALVNFIYEHIAQGHWFKLVIT